MQRTVRQWFSNLFTPTPGGQIAAQNVLSSKYAPVASNIKSSIYYGKEQGVSNILYALCKMFFGSHVPGIQALANENV